MKLITKVQSVSDIITNSSSEVFVTTENLMGKFSDEGVDSGCIYVTPIDAQWLLDNAAYEQELVCYVLGLRDCANYRWDAWDTYVQDNIDELSKKLDGYYFVEIEDHYGWDAFDLDRNLARYNSVYYDSRH